MIWRCHLRPPGGAVGKLGVIVELVLRVGLADRIRIGQWVQVGKQVEPRREVFGLPCRARDETRQMFSSDVCRKKFSQTPSKQPAVAQALCNFAHLEALLPLAAALDVF